MIKDALSWSTHTFSRCELGDSRLVKRLIKMGGALASKIGSCLFSCFEGQEAEMAAAYRFIRNESVDPAAMMAGVCAATAEQSKESECLLSIEDTTTLSYSHTVKEELGDLTQPDSASLTQGFLVHTVILYDPEKEKTLGIIDQKRWIRLAETYGKRHHRQSRDYVEKESFKWEDASIRVSERMGKDLKQVISVCDREADIFEYLAYKRKEKQRFIVRAAQDRSIYDEEGVCLSDQLMDSEKLSDFTVEIPQKGGRKARTATVQL